MDDDASGAVFRERRSLQLRSLLGRLRASGAEDDDPAVVAIRSLLEDDDTEPGAEPRG